MKIKVRNKGDVNILEISGKIMGGPDAESFHGLIKELIGEGKIKLLVNLAKVNWINSTGLGILIAGYTSVKDAGGQFKLLNVSERIDSILMVTKLAGIFDSFDNLEEALASFQD
jgi:anti-sigma B factor antagonist